MDKLCVSERRSKILDFLIAKKQSTRTELSIRFNVSKNTITRDIDYISSYAPIYTKQGNQGGIYILPEYRSYKNYLSDKEEKCLCALMNMVNQEYKQILEEIVIKFARNAEL